MKNPLLILVGLALIFGCMASYIHESEIVKQITLKTYDMFVRHLAVTPKSDRVVIVDIDETSLKRYGQWPWSRYVVAELADKLFAAGAAVVAFDVVFSERDRTSPVVLQKTLGDHFQIPVSIDDVPESLMDFDLLFADSLRRRKSILGCFMHPEPRNIVSVVDETRDPCYRGYFVTKALNRAASTLTNLLQAMDITISTPLLLKAAGNTAFFNVFPDEDNIVRTVPLVMAYGANRIYPSLALEALRMYRDVRQIVVEYDQNGIAAIRINEITVPTDPAGRLVVNFRKGAMIQGFSRCLPWYSVVRVLEGEVGRGQLGGKIVFVGTSAPGLRDLRATPLAAEVAGVEIHGMAVDNILSGDALQNPSWIRLVDLLAIFMTGLLLTLLIAKGRSWLSFLCMVLCIVMVIEFSLAMWHYAHIVVVPTRLILAIILIYMVLTVIRYWQEERQKRQVRQMFGTMVSQEVLVYLENNPGSFSLSGKKVDATMFFSDVAGFTSISENLDPEQLSELLNRYLSPMTTIIMNRHGYVDKYEGDAIMAEWGVPFPVNDHAVQACLSALEQQETLDVLRPILKRQFGVALTVRMGINSGRVTAGNMGSERRQQFTVMGDAVNQAARLEPVNKDYGTQIIIGETTCELIKDVLDVRLLDKLVVAGKTRPVQIYELMGRKGMVPEVRRQFSARYEEALKFHWSRQWDAAVERLNRALDLAPGDLSCLRLKERVVFYAQHPPLESWVGEHVRGSKD